VSLELFEVCLWVVMKIQGHGFEIIGGAKDCVVDGRTYLILVSAPLQTSHAMPHYAAPRHQPWYQCRANTLSLPSGTARFPHRRHRSSSEFRCCGPL
jgi:hypothetical protein